MNPSSVLYEPHPDVFPHIVPSVVKSCIFSNFEDKISQLSGISGTYKNLLMLKESSEQQQLF